MLVWLKAYKADIELGGLNPQTGIRSHSVNGRHEPSQIDRAVAAALADAARSQPSASRAQSPFAQLDVMHEHAREGILDTGTDSQLSAQQQSSVSLIGSFQTGANRTAAARINSSRETDPLVGSQSQSSRSLQGPSFSSNAFPSFGSSNNTEAEEMPRSPYPVMSDQQHVNGIVAEPHSSLGSPVSAAGTPRPRRAPPPPPVPASPFAMISPFAQVSQAVASPGFPPLDRASSQESSLSEKGSSEQMRRPTVRFAADPVPDNSRPYNHTNSGFTELAMARSGDASSNNRFRSNSDERDGSAHVNGTRPGIQRSLSRNNSRSSSKHERAASASLSVLDLPPLPLPAEAAVASGEPASPVASPMASRQPSRQMSLLRQMSGFRSASWLNPLVLLHACHCNFVGGLSDNHAT